MTQFSRFKTMKIKECRNLVISKGLCINCFAKGHRERKKKQWMWPQTQQVSTYANQTTVGHVDNSIPVTDQSVSTISSSTTNQSSHFCTCGGILAMPIVPARVCCPGSDIYIDTYAILDHSSNSTYCSENLCNQLELQETVPSGVDHTYTEPNVRDNNGCVFGCFQCE